MNVERYHQSVDGVRTAPSKPEAAAARSARLALASRLDGLDVVERVLTELTAAAEWPEDARYWVVTAAREAVVNAIEHGNHGNPELSVLVDIQVGPDELTIAVTDRGDGFDVADVPDPTLPENLLRPQGRGIFYMRQLMDRVEFRAEPEGGTTVLMTRRLERSP